MSKSLIGTRIMARRQERGLSQEELARLLGFRDRRAVSDIETGVRRVTADELMLAASKMEAPLEYFTDPFRLAGEGRFSWRRTNAGKDELAAYERDAGGWIAAFRVLAQQVGHGFQHERKTFRMPDQPTYEDAVLAARHFAADHSLGEVPALRLAEVMERDLGILVLMVDSCPGISGAACRLPELDAVLINRREVIGRRNFDLAHELFHLLTWDVMPPEHIEEATTEHRNHVERLADGFAAAVLMPVGTLEQFGPWRELTQEALIARLNGTADELQVTSSALRWRLVALRMLERNIAMSLNDEDLRNNGRSVSVNRPPALYSKTFAEVIGSAILQGHVSVRRVARLLDMSFEDLKRLFAAHGLPNPVEQ